jgi:hypothetical protein
VFTIVVLAATASAAFAGGEGGALGKSRARVNAAKACKAELALPEAEFRAAHNGKSFGEFYGRNRNGWNAYGKCVSSRNKGT